MLFKTHSNNREQPSQGSSLSKLLLASLFFVSCHARPPNQILEPQVAEVKESRLQQLLPLKNATVATFVTENDLGETGKFMLEVFRTSAESASLSVAGRSDALVIDFRGIRHSLGGYLLKEPLKQGSKFIGRFGDVTIARENLSIKVPAGHFQNCLETVEESLRPPKRATSVYCPNVGLVSLIVEAQTDAAVGRLQAELLQYEKRVDL